MKTEQFKKVLDDLQGVFSEISKVKDELSSEEFPVSAAAGMVNIIATGDRNIKKIQISDELWNTKDRKMIEDTLVAAINYALLKVDESLAERTKDKMQNSLGDIFNLGPDDIPL